MVAKVKSWLVLKMLPVASFHSKRLKVPFAETTTGGFKEGSKQMVYNSSKFIVKAAFTITSKDWIHAQDKSAYWPFTNRVEVADVKVSSKGLLLVCASNLVL